MAKNKPNKRFKPLFHSLIFFLAIGLIILSITAWRELDRAALYLILGIVLIVESAVRTYKYFKRMPPK